MAYYTNNGFPSFFYALSVPFPWHPRLNQDMVLAGCWPSFLSPHPRDCSPNVAERCFRFAPPQCPSFPLFFFDPPVSEAAMRVVFVSVRSSTLVTSFMNYSSLWNPVNVITIGKQPFGYFPPRFFLVWFSRTHHLIPPIAPLRLELEWQKKTVFGFFLCF